MLAIALASATLVTLGVVLGLSELREGREGASPPHVVSNVPQAPALPETLEPPLGLPRAEPDPAERPTRTQTPVLASPDTTASGESDPSGAPWEIRIFDSRLLPDSVEAFAIDLSGGNVEVVSSDNTYLEIEGQVRVQREIDARPWTSAFSDHVRIEQTEGLLRIEDTHGEPERWHYDLLVRLPAALPLEVETGSGDITLRWGRAEVRANTDSGTIRLDVRDHPIARMDLNTGSGSLQLDFSSAQAMLTANTGSGHVQARAWGPPGKGQVFLNSGSGDVRLQVPLDQTGSYLLRSADGAAILDPDLGLEIESREPSRVQAHSSLGSLPGRFQLTAESGNAELAPLR